MAQRASNDKIALWGVLGIALSLCCLPVGVVFSVLSLNEARKVDRQPTLAYVGFGLAGLWLLASAYLLGITVFGAYFGN